MSRLRTRPICALCGRLRTRHALDCPARPRGYYSQAEQEHHEHEAKREELACPAHDFTPAVDCPACVETADYDHGTDI